MAKNRKAQAAIEYLMVFGLALALSVPFVIKAQTSMVDIQTSSQILEARNSLNRIESAAKTVNAAGEPARRTFSIDIPESTTNSAVGTDYVQLSINTSRAYVDLDRRFDFNVTGSLPEEDGRHLISASAVNGSVSFRVVE